jgi:integrase
LESLTPSASDYREIADSKTGRKTVILNAPALAALDGLDRLGPYVVADDDPEKPRADLKRPWDAVARRAGLSGVRLHDLRHTYASFGAGGGLPRGLTKDDHGGR